MFEQCLLVARDEYNTLQLTVFTDNINHIAKQAQRINRISDQGVYWSSFSTSVSKAYDFKDPQLSYDDMMLARGLKQDEFRYKDHPKFNFPQSLNFSIRFMNYVDYMAAEYILSQFVTSRITDGTKFSDFKLMNQFLGLQRRNCYSVLCDNGMAHASGMYQISRILRQFAMYYDDDIYKCCSNFANGYRKWLETRLQQVISHDMNIDQLKRNSGTCPFYDGLVGEYKPHGVISICSYPPQVYVYQEGMYCMLPQYTFDCFDPLRHTFELRQGQFFTQINNIRTIRGFESIQNNRIQFKWAGLTKTVDEMVYDLVYVYNQTFLLVSQYEKDTIEIRLTYTVEFVIILLEHVFRKGKKNFPLLGYRPVQYLQFILTGLHSVFQYSVSFVHTMLFDYLTFSIGMYLNLSPILGITDIFYTVPVVSTFGSTLRMSYSEYKQFDIVIQTACIAFLEEYRHCDSKAMASIQTPVWSMDRLFQVIKGCTLNPFTVYTQYFGNKFIAVQLYDMYLDQFKLTFKHAQLVEDADFVGKRYIDEDQGLRESAPPIVRTKEQIREHRRKQKLIDKIQPTIYHDFLMNDDGIMDTSRYDNFFPKPYLAKSADQVMQDTSLQVPSLPLIPQKIVPPGKFPSLVQPSVQVLEDQDVVQIDTSSMKVLDDVMDTVNDKDLNAEENALLEQQYLQQQQDEEQFDAQMAQQYQMFEALPKRVKTSIFRKFKPPDPDEFTSLTKLEKAIMAQSKRINASIDRLKLKDERHKKKMENLHRRLKMLQTKRSEWDTGPKQGTIQFKKVDVIEPQKVDAIKDIDDSSLYEIHPDDLDEIAHDQYQYDQLMEAEQLAMNAQLHDAIIYERDERRQLHAKKKRDKVKPKKTLRVTNVVGTTIRKQLQVPDFDAIPDYYDDDVPVYEQTIQVKLQIQQAQEERKLQRRLEKEQIEAEKTRLKKQIEDEKQARIKRIVAHHEERERLNAEQFDRHRIAEEKRLEVWRKQQDAFLDAAFKAQDEEEERERLNALGFQSKRALETKLKTVAVARSNLDFEDLTKKLAPFGQYFDTKEIEPLKQWTALAYLLVKRYGNHLQRDEWDTMFKGYMGHTFPGFCMILIDELKLNATVYVQGKDLFKVYSSGLVGRFTKKEEQSFINLNQTTQFEKRRIEINKQFDTARLAHYADNWGKQGYMIITVPDDAFPKGPLPNKKSIGCFVVVVVGVDDVYIYGFSVIHPFSAYKIIRKDLDREYSTSDRNAIVVVRPDSTQIDPRKERLVDRDAFIGQRKRQTQDDVPTIAPSKPRFKYSIRRQLNDDE